MELKSRRARLPRSQRSVFTETELTDGKPSVARDGVAGSSTGAKAWRRGDFVSSAALLMMIVSEMFAPRQSVCAPRASVAGRAARGAWRRRTTASRGWACGPTRMWRTGARCASAWSSASGLTRGAGAICWRSAWRCRCSRTTQSRTTWCVGGAPPSATLRPRSRLKGGVWGTLSDAAPNWPLYLRNERLVRREGAARVVRRRARLRSAYGHHLGNAVAHARWGRVALEGAAARQAKTWLATCKASFCGRTPPPIPVSSHLPSAY